MSDSNTPRTDALHFKLLQISETPNWIAGKDYVEMKKHSGLLEKQLSHYTKIVEAAWDNYAEHNDLERSTFCMCVLCRTLHPIATRRDPLEPT